MTFIQLSHSNLPPVPLCHIQATHTEGTYYTNHLLYPLYYPLLYYFNPLILLPFHSIWFEFAFGVIPALFRNYSWQYSRDHRWHLDSNTGQLNVRQEPLYSGPIHTVSLGYPCCCLEVTLRGARPSALLSCLFQLVSYILIGPPSAFVGLPATKHTRDLWCFRQSLTDFSPKIPDLPGSSCSLSFPFPSCPSILGHSSACHFTLLPPSLLTAPLLGCYQV